MNFEGWIERFKDQMELLNYSARSWATARGVLRQMRVYLESQEIYEVSAVTKTALNGFRHWLFSEPTWKGTARAIASQNRCLSVVKGFFRFLHEEGVVVADPAEGMTYAKEPQILPRNVLTVQEARKILTKPDIQTALGYRDRTILEVFYSTGIRRSELISLTVANVDLEAGLLRINGGKGAKDRVVPLTQIAVTFLESYINGIRPNMMNGKEKERLFLSERGLQMGKNTVSGVVEKYAKLARIKKRVTPHCWRHTCATHLVQNAANLRHVQEMLGHKNLSTTERYLQLTITDLKEAHRKFHPREREK